MHYAMLRIQVNWKIVMAYGQEIFTKKANAKDFKMNNPNPNERNDPVDTQSYVLVEFCNNYKTFLETMKSMIWPNFYTQLQSTAL